MYYSLYFLVKKQQISEISSSLLIIPNVEIASEVDTDADVPQLVHTADISPVKDFCVQTTHLHRTLSKHRTALNKSGINPKFTRE